MKVLTGLGALVLAAGLAGGLAACGPSAASSGLTPGSATADQICQAQVGSSVQSSLTGQDLHETVKSVETGSVISNLNASGNEVVNCTLTLSTGLAVPKVITLFPDGTTGW